METEEVEQLLWNVGERYEGNADLHMNPMTVKQAAAAISSVLEEETQHLRQELAAGVTLIRCIRREVSSIEYMRGLSAEMLEFIRRNEEE